MIRLSFFVIGLIFWYGSRQLVSREVTSTSFFVTMISIVFASIQVGNVFNFVPDMSKARGAANDIVNLSAMEPEIDADSTAGIKVTKTEGTITFQGESY
jgi:ATP-binding cassette subfamily B (MDR/TAP) protein 1